MSRLEQLTPIVAVSLLLACGRSSPTPEGAAPATVTAERDIRTILAQIAVLLIGALLAGCGNGSTAPAPDTLVYARGADSIKLDPADITDGESVKVLEIRRKRA